MQVIQLAALLLVLGSTHATMTTSPIEMVTSILMEAAKHMSSDMTIVTERAKRSLFSRQLQDDGSECEQELTIDEFSRCQTVAHGTACDSGLQEELYTIAKQCGQDQLAQNSRLACGINDDGKYCYQALGIRELSMPELLSCYLSTSCSMTCRNGINRLNDQLGCCSSYWAEALPTLVSNLFDSLLPNLIGNQPSNIIGNLSSILTRNLWSSCGVSPGTQCTNTPTFPSVNKTRNCSISELSQIQLTHRCNQNESQVVAALANTTGCGGLAIVSVEACSVDSSGSFCASKIDLSIYIPLYQHVHLNCATDVTSSSCSSACQASLLSLRNEFGCCINSLFNGTLAKTYLVTIAQASLRYFTYSLWSRCNVEPPGVCDSPVSDSLPTDLKCDNVSGSVKVEGIFSLILVLILAALFN